MTEYRIYYHGSFTHLSCFTLYCSTIYDALEEFESHGFTLLQIKSIQIGKED